LTARLRIRRDVYRLATADALRAKVTNPAAVLAVLVAIAAAVTAAGLFAVAPQKSEDATAVALVAVTLSDTGQQCPAPRSRVDR
jgi:hypothetical protein